MSATLRYVQEGGTRFETLPTAEACLTEALWLLKSNNAVPVDITEDGNTVFTYHDIRALSKGQA